MPEPPKLPDCGCGHGITIHTWDPKKKLHRACTAFDNGRKCLCGAYGPVVRHG